MMTSTPTRSVPKEDDGDEGRMATSLKQHGVFHNKVNTLQNMINNDLLGQCGRHVRHGIVHIQFDLLRGFLWGFS